MPLALLAAALLCGCTTTDFSVRTLPPETPAADNAAATEQLRKLQGQLSGGAGGDRTTSGAQLGPPLTDADVPSMRTYDPWERMNRATYRFNARFDEAIFLPVANGYRRLPAPVRSGVHNFFANLSEVVSFLNYTAQLRPVQSVRSLGRFIINSTLGLGGLFDVASSMHIPAARTGLGQTLARWGVRPGPYFVLPFLGPSTLRNGFGFVGDFGTSYAINLGGLYQGTAGWALTPLNAVDMRADTPFRYYASGSPFEYDTVRFLYVRRTLIEDDAVRLWHRRPRQSADAPAGE